MLMRQQPRAYNANGGRTMPKSKKLRGRPPRGKIEPIPDTPENVARIVMQATIKPKDAKEQASVEAS